MPHQINESRFPLENHGYGYCKRHQDMQRMSNIQTSMQKLCKLLKKFHDLHHQVCIDFVGPWNINTTKNEAPVTLLALPIIYPATSWFVTTLLLNKGSYTVAIAFDQQWVFKFPQPLKFIHDNGREFVGMEFQEMLATYGVQAVITTVANPQANAIIECNHQVTSNMLRISSPIRNPQQLSFASSNYFIQNNGQSIQPIIQLLKHCLHN